MSALSESAEAPLQRGSGSDAFFFDTATVTLSGVLPAGFSGVARAQVMGIFRALEIVLSPGRYRVSGFRFRDSDLSPKCKQEGQVTREAPTDRAWTLRVPHPQAIDVGGVVEVFLENSSDQPEPFEIQFRGHSAEPWHSGPPSFQEIGTATVLEAERQKVKAESSGSSSVQNEL